MLKINHSRFPNLQQKDFDLDSTKYMCLLNDSKTDCDKKTAEFKEKILKELSKVFSDESNILKIGTENPYNVQYRGIKSNYADKLAKTVLCQLMNTRLNTLRRNDVGTHPLKDYIPKRSLFENKRFNSCAVVSSSGALKDSGLGKFIGK